MTTAHPTRTSAAMPTVPVLIALLLLGLFGGVNSFSLKFPAPISCGVRFTAKKCRSTNPGGGKACCWVDNFCVSRKKSASKPDPCFTPTCPPPGFDSVAGFSLWKYISAPWYPLMQMPLVYQPKDSLYCVRAKYEPIDRKNLKKGLRVKNYANKGRVNGPAMGTSGAAGSSMTLIAVPQFPKSTSPTTLSKLLVGPATLQNYLPRGALKLVYGPYWVVAVGPSKNPKLGYDWAIVSGGAPKTRTKTACRTGFKSILSKYQVNGVGLWFFARKPNDAKALAAMKAKATALGYDLSVLRTVEQKGCTYQGAD